MKPERILFLAGAGMVLAALAFGPSRQWQDVLLFVALLAVNLALMLGWRINKS